MIIFGTDKQKLQKVTFLPCLVLQLHQKKAVPLQRDQEIRLAELSVKVQN